MTTPSKYLLVLGAGTMQLPIFEQARQLGLGIIAADGNPRAPGAQEADVFLPDDLKDPEGILKSVRIVGLDSKIVGVFTAGTDFSYSVAVIAEELGLPGILPQTALAASNKGLMRQRFAEARVSSPKYSVLSATEFTAQGLSSVVGSVAFPWVIKPVDNMGSRGVQKVANEDQAWIAVSVALDYSRTAQVIIEEFIPGLEYSIDSLFYKGDMIAYAIARRSIHFPPYFVETGHSFPSGLSLEEESVVVEEFSKGVLALGILNGAAKGDVFWDGRRASIGEIAARLSGGYMSGWTLPYARGMNFTRAAIQIALGQQPDPQPIPTKDWCVIESALVSFPGKVSGVEILDHFESLPGYQNLFLRCKPGDILSFPRNNVEKAGNIIFAHPDPVICRESTTKALNSLFLRLDPEYPRSIEILDHPDHPEIPVAYPKNLGGSDDPNELGWDGRAYRDGITFLEKTLKRSVERISPSVLEVFRRYGLQAAVLKADIQTRGEGGS